MRPHDRCPSRPRATSPSLAQHPHAQVVLLDVLRATSTITASLANGAREIRLYGSLESARAARRSWNPSDGPVRLAGEKNCLKPDDFDLGNSPREHATEKVGNAVVLLATTNGTRRATHIQHAHPKKIFAASLLNASATAQALLADLQNIDTFFACAGTNGALAMEDVLGAGAILFALLQSTYRTDLPFTDNAWLAYHAFTAVKTRLPAALRLGLGGLNVLDAGLEEDIDFCARLDALAIAVEINPETIRATKK